MDAWDPQNIPATPQKPFKIQSGGSKIRPRVLQDAPGWAGLTGSAAQVANVGSMGSQWRANSRPRDARQDLNYQQVAESRPRGRIGLGF